MTEKKAKDAKQVKPHFELEKRVRICGKWQEPGYKATDEEQAIYKRRQDIQKKRKADIAKLEKGKK